MQSRGKKINKSSCGMKLLWDVFWAGAVTKIPLLTGNSFKNRKTLFKSHLKSQSVESAVSKATCMACKVYLLVSIRFVKSAYFCVVSTFHSNFQLTDKVFIETQTCLLKLGPVNLHPSSALSKRILSFQNTKILLQTFFWHIPISYNKIVLAVLLLI